MTPRKSFIFAIQRKKGIIVGDAGFPGPGDAGAFLAAVGEDGGRGPAPPGDTAAAALDLSPFCAFGFLITRRIFFLLT